MEKNDLIQMDAYFMGKLFNFLLKYRVLRTKIPPGERAKPNEKELAWKYHEEISEIQRSFFSSFLLEQGFRLASFSYAMMKGIAFGGTYYILLRDPVSGDDVEVPSWIDPKGILNELKIDKSEPDSTTRVWIFTLWQVLLSLMYSTKNRELTAVSRYVDAVFTKEEFLLATQKLIEELRQEGGIAGDSPVNALFERPRLKNRVTKFIGFLENLHYVEDNKDGSYTQTLLAAKELEENFNQEIDHLIPSEKLSSAMYENFYNDTSDVEEQEVVDHGPY